MVLTKIVNDYNTGKIRFKENQRKCKIQIQTFIFGISLKK